MLSRMEGRRGLQHGTGTVIFMARSTTAILAQNRSVAWDDIFAKFLDIYYSLSPVAQHVVLHITRRTRPTR